MPPKRNRRRLDKKSGVENVVPDSKEHENDSPQASATITAAVVPTLATIPPELFDEIFSYFSSLPLSWYHDATPGCAPDIKYAEGSRTLRAVASTCRALRAIALPRLWSRVDTAWVPEHAMGIWYKYVMAELRRKADGVQTLEPSVRGYVRTVSMMLSKSDIKGTVAYIPKLLISLPALHTIHVLTLKVTNDFKAALSGLVLPSVRMLVIPTGANALIRACPNVVHVRCAGGDGSALIAALKSASKCQVLDGMIDWCRDPKLTNRLINNAPGLTTLEIRHPASWGLGYSWENPRPTPQWANIIPGLSDLKELRSLTVTLAYADELPSDKAIIEAARTLMRTSELSGARKLIVRRVKAPHYLNYTPPHDLDVVMSSSIEIFLS